MISLKKSSVKNESILSGRIEVDYLNEKYYLNLPEKDDYEMLAGMILFYPEVFQEIMIYLRSVILF
jgi:CBS domain containing-hemolysin-like protein